MAQTLVIGLEKQKDQPTPSEVPPQTVLIRVLLEAGGLIESVEGALAAPSCLLTKVGEPHHGGPTP